MRTVKGLVLALLAACGGGQDPAAQQSPVTETPVTETPADTTAETPEQPTPPEEKPLPPPPKKLTLEERIAFHAGCFKDFLAEAPDFFDKCYTEESSDQIVDSGMPVGKGRAAIAASTKPFWDAFTLEGETRLTLGNGDNVLSIAWIGGTNDGPMMGKPATKKKFGLLSAEVQNLDGQGRHGDVRLYMDMGTWMAHLGQGPKGMAFRKAAKKTGAEGPVVIATGSETETANVELVKSGFEMFNSHDAKGLAAKYDAKAVFANQAFAADVKGKAIQGMFTDMFKAFPDAQEQVGNIWAAGDYVVVETTFTGTNKGAMKAMGVKKATGKPVSLHGAHVLKLANGKVVEHWVFANGMAVAMQLGLIKAPGEPAAPAADAAKEKKAPPAKEPAKAPPAKEPAKAPK